MENPMPSTQTPLQSQSNPPQAPPQTSPKQRYILAVLTGAIALCIVVGSGGYYLGRKNQNNRPIIVSSLAPTSIQITVTPTKPAEGSTPTMLPDWKYETDPECGVTMPIPPAESPYITSSIGEHDMDAGHIWILTHAGAYPELIAKVADTYESIHTYAAMFGSTKRSLGSGYISSMVTVHCAPNSNGYNNDQLVTVLKEKLNEYNKIPHQSEHGKQPDRYVLTSVIDGKRWGQNVVDIQFDEVSDTGEKVSKNNTMFSTPTHIYQINIDGQSQNSFIKETAQKIFDNLSFQSGSTEKPVNTSNIQSAPLISTDGWKMAAIGDTSFKLPPSAYLQDAKSQGNTKCEPPTYCYVLFNHDKNYLFPSVSIIVKPYKGGSRRVEAQKVPGILPGVYDYVEKKYGDVTGLDAEFKCQIEECMSSRNVIFLVKNNLVVITEGIYKAGEESIVDGQKTITTTKESSITNSIISTFK